ncbi:molybdate ABC transporter substrate-binding protein [Ruminococcaceae bacterium OttesenSCG-928-I18]|nr:molybdate ABC transporter substrate-binding protein [Ruminococcaceae bacterium OttesenSCG-928-I18]
MRKAFTLLTALLMCTTLLLSGCSGGDTAASSAAPPASEAAPASTPAADVSSTLPQADQEPVEIMLAAAASLEDSYVNQLIPLFQEQYPWVTVTGTYGSSGNLQTQIEEGMAADVFMSAATKQMDALVEGGFIEESSVVDLLENEIVLIAPADADTSISSFEQITEAQTIAIGDPESVPAGQYAEEVLTNLGLWDQVQPSLTLGTDVTQVLNWVAESSADVGIVYATDAAQMPDQVKILSIAPEGSLETPVIYPVGVLSESAHQEAAALFVEFLQTPEAMDIFIENGFKSNL